MIMGCEVVDIVFVVVDFSFLVVSVGLDQELGCVIFEVMLNGIGSIIFNIIFEWIGFCLFGDVIVQDIFVICDGFYILFVIDIFNGCIERDMAVVIWDLLSFNVILLDSIVLFCLEGIVLFDVIVLEGDIFSWFFNGVLILFGGFSFMIDSVGIYILIVNNLVGDCLDIVFVVVILDCSFVFQIVVFDILICVIIIIILNVIGMEFGLNFIYIWLALGFDCIEFGGSILQLIVCCLGIYQFIVINIIFSFSDILVVIVFFNILFFIVEVGLGDILICLEFIMILSVIGLIVGLGIGYIWIKLDDEIFVKDSFSIFVNDVSIYFLIVIDSINGCFVEDIVVVQCSNNLLDINFSFMIIFCMQDFFWLQVFVVF